MTVMELAKQIGEAISASEEMQAAKAAEEAYEKDSELQKLIFEYNAQNAALAEEYKKDVKDQEFIEVINRRISELYNSIAASEVYLKYLSAQKKVGELMNAVNNEINRVVYGEPANCTHDCSSCHGCH